MNPNQNPSASLYGFHAVREAYLNAERDVHILYLTDTSLKGFEDTIREAKQSGLNRPKPTIIEKSKFDRLAPKGAVHQGVAICCSDTPEYDLQDFIIRTSGQKRAMFAILDQVTDPHNVGAILRSASAFGLDGVIMQKKHAPALNGVLAKTACGAIDHIPVAQTTNLSRAVTDLQDAGFFVIGMDERGEDIRQMNAPDKLVLILGAEGPGMRRLLKDNCDSLIKIPMHQSIASINVSNAAAVAFYALSNTK